VIVASRRGGRRRGSASRSCWSCLGSILAPFALTVAWVHGEMLNTDRYVVTVAPLASDAAVRTAVADRLSDFVLDNVDVEGVVRSALPSAAKGLAGPVAQQVEQFVRAQANAVVSSRIFAASWKSANLVAHRAVAALLFGRRLGPLNQSSGAVTVDLTGVVATLQTDLCASGIPGISKVHLPTSLGQFVIFSSSGLARTQRFVRILDQLTWQLPLATVVCLARAVGCSWRRRRTVAMIGVGVLTGGLVLVAGVDLGRAWYLDAVSGSVIPRPAAAAVFDALIHVLRDWALIIVLAGAAVGIAAWALGPSPCAIEIRVLARRVGGLGRRGDQPSPVLSWLSDHRKVGAAVVTGVGAVALVAWPHPSPLTVLLIAVIILGTISALTLTAAPGRSKRLRS
jgi:hypothetical protein